MDSGDPEGPGRGALVALVVIAALVAGGFWLWQRVQSANAVQDCVMAGRSNCAALP